MRKLAAILRPVIQSMITGLLSLYKVPFAFAAKSLLVWNGVFCKQELNWTSRLGVSGFLQG